MIWVALAIIAQFLSAAVFIFDKYLVGPKAIGRPAVYAIYISLLSGVVVLLLPFGIISLPGQVFSLIYLAIAGSFIASIVLLYSSLQIADASDVAPAMGAIAAISTLIFSYIILDSKMPEHFFRGFPFLIIGTFLMSRFRFNFKTSAYIICAGVLAGFSSVLMKYAFQNVSFWDGFFWSRMANVLGAIILLIWPANFRAVFSNLKQSTGETKILVIGNKVLAGFSFFLLLWAINLGNVSIVNALAGFQFVFLLVFASIVTYKLPKYFHEAVHRKENLYKKIAASGLIFAGFILLFL